jgi:hypothetical protein
VTRVLNCMWMDHETDPSLELFVDGIRTRKKQLVDGVPQPSARPWFDVHKFVQEQQQKSKSWSCPGEDEARACAKASAGPVEEEQVCPRSASSSALEPRRAVLTCIPSVRYACLADARRRRWRMRRRRRRRIPLVQRLRSRRARRTSLLPRRQPSRATLRRLRATASQVTTYAPSACATPSLALLEPPHARTTCPQPRGACATARAEPDCARSRSVHDLSRSRAQRRARMVRGLEGWRAPGATSARRRFRQRCKRLADTVTAAAERMLVPCRGVPEWAAWMDSGASASY